MLSTLQQLAAPFASFTPLGGDRGLTWKAGSCYAFALKLFGVIPFGTHRIHVLRFGLDEGICTHEGNEHIPIWNHEIILRELDANCCEYTDRVEVGAGWKTLSVYWWAKLFYAHRQRKWISMLEAQR